MSTDKKKYHPAAAAWKAIGKGDIASLRAILVSPASTSEDRFRAALWLGKHRHTEALPELAAALDDPDVFVRTAAVEGLARLDLSEADDLVGAVARGDDEFMVRAPALEASVRRADRSMLEPLVDVSRADRIWTRRFAVRQLGKLGDPRAAQAIHDARSRDTWWNAPRYWVATQRLKK